MNQREDVLSAGEALQLPGADVGQLGPSRKLVGHQLGGRPGKQDLATPGEGAQSSGPVHCLTVVVALAQLSLPAMQRRPCAQDAAGRPGFSQQCLLQP
jgi:hypothetical protein